VVTPSSSHDADDLSLGMRYERPRFVPPHRVLVLVAATEAWWQAPHAEREELMPLLARLLAAPDENVNLLASFDDDYFMTGAPTTIPFSMHLIYEIADPDAIVGMVHEIRSSKLGGYFRVEARLGRRVFLVHR
jgi:hypothetical protein